MVLSDPLSGLIGGFIIGKRIGRFICFVAGIWYLVSRNFIGTTPRFH